MNWSYVSGFFDADGSISLLKSHSKESKTIQVSFHNTQECILIEIRKFIESELGFKGSLSKKTAKKANHSNSYDLKYLYKQGLEVMNKMELVHPKKIHRHDVYKRIQECTPRNGKYTKELLAKRLELEEEFFEG